MEAEDSFYDDDGWGEVQSVDSEPVVMMETDFFEVGSLCVKESNGLFGKLADDANHWNMFQSRTFDSDEEKAATSDKEIDSYNNDVPVMQETESVIKKCFSHKDYSGHRVSADVVNISDRNLEQDCIQVPEDMFAHMGPSISTQPRKPFSSIVRSSQLPTKSILRSSGKYYQKSFLSLIDTPIELTSKVTHTESDDDFFKSSTIKTPFPKISTSSVREVSFEQRNVSSEKVPHRNLQKNFEEIEGDSANSVTKISEETQKSRIYSDLFQKSDWITSLSNKIKTDGNASNTHVLEKSAQKRDRVSLSCGYVARLENMISSVDSESQIMQFKLQDNTEIVDPIPCISSSSTNLYSNFFVCAVSKNPISYVSNQKRESFATAIYVLFCVGVNSNGILNEENPFYVVLLNMDSSNTTSLLGTYIRAYLMQSEIPFNKFTSSSILQVLKCPTLFFYSYYEIPGEMISPEVHSCVLSYITLKSSFLRFGSEFNYFKFESLEDSKCINNAPSSIATIKSYHDNISLRGRIQFVCLKLYSFIKVKYGEEFHGKIYAASLWLQDDYNDLCEVLIPLSSVVSEECIDLICNSESCIVHFENLTQLNPLSRYDNIETISAMRSICYESAVRNISQSLLCLSESSNFKIYRDCENIPPLYRPESIFSVSGLLKDLIDNHSLKSVTKRYNIVVNLLGYWRISSNEVLFFVSNVGSYDDLLGFPKIISILCTSNVISEALIELLTISSSHKISEDLIFSKFNSMPLLKLRSVKCCVSPNPLNSSSSYFYDIILNTCSSFILDCFSEIQFCSKVANNSFIKCSTSLLGRICTISPDLVLYTECPESFELKDFEQLSRRFCHVIDHIVCNIDGVLLDCFPIVSSEFKFCYLVSVQLENVLTVVAVVNNEVSNSNKFLDTIVAAPWRTLSVDCFKHISSRRNLLFSSNNHFVKFDCISHEIFRVTSFHK